MARLFFAIWPGDEAARTLADVSLALAGLSGGKPVPREKIHLTLAFLGSLSPGEIGEATRIAAAVRSPRFGFTLDHVGSFRRARVAWAGPPETPAALASLQSNLADALRGAGFRLDERPFAPHVTLARKIERAVPRAPMPPAEWRVDELTLARSETGTGRYSIADRWPLGGT
jgi:2'-5' RNA ligase